MLPKTHALPSRRHARQGIFLALTTLFIVLAAAVPAAGGATAATSAASAPPRALILAPFATDWGDFAVDMQIENQLKTAGFAVTVYRDHQITVPLMKTLNRYSFIFIASHVGPLPNGDAAIATADTRHAKFQKYLNNYTLAEMHILHNGVMRWFDAIDGRFIHFYGGHFRKHTIIMISGCNTLDMPLFWHYLKVAGVGTLVAWAHHVYSTDGDRASESVLSSMLTGETVLQALADATAAGVAVSTVQGQKKAGNFAYLGDGTMTLQKITGVAPPTPSPTSTATATPTSTP